MLLEHHVGGREGQHEEAEHEVGEGEAHDERVRPAPAQFREQQYRQNDQHVTRHDVHIEHSEHSCEHREVNARCDALEAVVAGGPGGGQRRSGREEGMLLWLLRAVGEDVVVALPEGCLEVIDVLQETDAERVYNLRSAFVREDLAVGGKHRRAGEGQRGGRDFERTRDHFVERGDRCGERLAQLCVCQMC